MNMLNNSFSNKFFAGQNLDIQILFCKNPKDCKFFLLFFMDINTLYPFFYYLHILNLVHPIY